MGVTLGKRGGKCELPGMRVRLYVPGENGGVSFSIKHYNFK
jgi:hypothetical protein